MLLALGAFLFVVLLDFFKDGVRLLETSVIFGFPVCFSESLRKMDSGLKAFCFLVSDPDLAVPLLYMI